MKVTGPGQVQSKGITKKAKKASSDGSVFSHELSGTSASAPSQSAAPASPLSSVNALLSLQEVPTATDGRSKGLSRGASLLDQLEEIRRGILLGAIPVRNLRGLASMARQGRGQTGDARLDEVLLEIETRAEVELAKYGF